jgi:hypothetical protein
MDCREYKKYGDISVRVIIEPDERVAYVYFRYSDRQLGPNVMIT